MPAGGERGRAAPAAPTAADRRGDAFGAGVRARCSRERIARGRRVLRASACPRPRPTTSGRVAAAGVRRAALVQAVLPLRRARTGSTGDPAQPPPPAERPTGRNAEWPHLYNRDVISMPDKWEYPWYAAWDLAFHMIPFARDRSRLRQGAAAPAAARVVHAPERADPGLRVRLRRRESAGARVGLLARLQDDRRRAASATALFLERVFQKLLLNFTWWVNRKDAEGQQPLRRRLPRPRQHRRLRPLAAAARRRPPRAGRRHGVDGVLLQHDAGDGARARAARTRPTRTWRRSSSSTSSPSPTR